MQATAAQAPARRLRRRLKRLRPGSRRRRQVAAAAAARRSGAVERCAAARHGRPRGTRPQGIQPSWRMGGCEAGRWRRAQELGGLPERAQKAGVVLVIHDIRGLSDMARALGDQLAQDGFIAIVPDFLSGKGPNGGGTESLGSEVGKTIQSLTPADVVARLNAAMDNGQKLPASNARPSGRLCWGGARSFAFRRRSRTSMPRSCITATRPARLTAHRRPRSPTSRRRCSASTRATTRASTRRFRRRKRRCGSGQELRRAYLRGRGPRLHVLARRRRRRQPESGQESWPVVLQFFRQNLQ